MIAESGRSKEKPRHPAGLFVLMWLTGADDCPMVSRVPVMLRPVEPRNRLESASEFRLMHMHQIISFKDDTFPLKRLRLPDVPSRLKGPSVY
jgi:hypothetical protein